ncbi:MAG TPA: hypothetical protein VEW65_10875 [Chryseolinea sp.]|nr:hypothetical protein [Chryseolinea sp.]
MQTLNTMGTVELKSDLRKILDKIEDEQLLRTIYDFLKQSENAEVGKIWKTLTEEQKKEVYASYEESKDDKNLTSWEDVKKKY